MKYRAAVITISDSCYKREKNDESGPALRTALEEAGFEIAASEVVPDDRSIISSILQKYAILPEVDLIFTTGGTGFSPRDVTPEATRDVIERPASGIAEYLRLSGAAQTPFSWLSRGEAGIASGKLIVNLPGSPKAIKPSIEALRDLLLHALELLLGRSPH
jgi:molybdopterin adenylyltransferase